MKRVFLYAYDRQNLGDDLFVHAITRRYPDVRFYMWSHKKNRKTYASLPNLKVIDSNSHFVQFLQKLRPSLVVRYKSWLEKRCDAVVYIGGSIFMEYPSWMQICNWWEYEAQNRPLYVLGANFGPYHTEAYREKMAEIFGSCRDVCFRDHYSKELFRNVATVRRSPDILFSYPMPKCAVKEEQIFVSVINCAGRDECHSLSQHDERYVANMAALLRRLLDAGRKLVLASFCAEEGDAEGIRKILAAMGCEQNPSVQVLHYDGTNVEEITGAIAESGGVIATRFHAAILAIAAGRPVLPLVYSDKTKHVLEDLGFAGTICDLRVDSNWDHAEMTVAVPPTVCNGGHFEKLDQRLR